MIKKRHGITAMNLMLRMVLRVGFLLTLLLAAVLLLAAYGGHIDPRTTAKPSVFTLALPYVAIFTGAVMLVWALLRQWSSAAVALLAIVLAWPSIRVVCPLNVFPPRVSADEEMLKFKVLTFNAMYFIYDEQEYWNNDNKAFDYLLNCGSDLILVQEGDIGKYLEQMPAVKERYGELKSKYPYRTDDCARNLSMLSRYPFTLEEEIIDEDSSLLACVYKMKIKGRELNVVNMHLQSLHLNKDDKQLYLEYTNPHNMKEKIDNSDRLRKSVWAKLQMAFRHRADQVDLLRAKIDELGENVIVCGDFNDTPCSYAYRTVRGDDFNDAYQDCGFGPEITYHENRFYFKIDQILYRGDMHAVKVERPALKISDHYPLMATMAWHSRED